MKKIMTLIASVLLLAGCSSSSGAIDLSVTEFSSKITEPGVVTLDVRTPAEFAEGYIEGFTNVYNMNGGVIDWANAGLPLVTN